MTEEKRDILTFHRYYFIIFMVTDKITEDKGYEIVNKIFDVYNNGNNNYSKNLCEILEVKKCGLKKLNYIIKKHDSAFYYTMMIKVLEDEELKIVLNEITRIIKGEERIIRHLLCRNPDPTHLPMATNNINSLKPLFDKAIAEAMASPSFSRR